MRNSPFSFVRKVGFNEIDCEKWLISAFPQ